jgi:HD-GYP domain-containing protein (c-di-GMP phosphodiesterase class II)
MNAGKVLYTACSEEEVEVLRESVGVDELRHIPLDQSLLPTPTGERVRLLVLGHHTQGSSISEVSEQLKQVYPDVTLVLLTSEPMALSRKELLNLGFAEVYYLPLERSLFKHRYGSAEVSPGLGYLILHSVKVHDLMNLRDLSINTYVYLPNNKRYIPFNVAGHALDEAKKQRLRNKNITNLYIDQRDLPRFYASYATSIKALQSSETVSETQKRELLKEISRDFLGELFTEVSADEAAGMRVNSTCREIVLSYLSEASEVVKWHAKLNSTTGDRDEFYTKSSNIMIASVLIAIGLGLDQKNIEALAIAALLRDLGLTMLPGYLVSRSPAEMTIEEKEIYEKYPIHTLELLRQRKVLLPELTQKIILQQNEKFDGTGSPNALMGREITYESQILFLVGHLISRASSRPGHIPLTFIEAFNMFRDDYYQNPTDCPLNPLYLNQINDLLTIKKSNAIEPKKVSGGKWTMS